MYVGRPENYEYSKTTNRYQLILREGRSSDSEPLGNICFTAFKTISEKHGFPPDFPAPEEAIGLVSMLLSQPDVYSVVAENGGQLVGSNFLWEGDAVAGVGPITVDPATQNSAIGRALMNDVLRHADEKGILSVRLVQAAFHNRSLSLYTKLGFNTVEPLSLIQGTPPNVNIEGCSVRKMAAEDIAGADALALSVHGHTRHNEVVGALAQGGRDGRRTRRTHHGIFDRARILRPCGR